jgi:hypothetical protein
LGPDVPPAPLQRGSFEPRSLEHLPFSTFEPALPYTYPPPSTQHGSWESWPYPTSFGSTTPQVAPLLPPLPLAQPPPLDNQLTSLGPVLAPATVQPDFSVSQPPPYSEVTFLAPVVPTPVQAAAPLQSNQLLGEKRHGRLHPQSDGRSHLNEHGFAYDRQSNTGRNASIVCPWWILAGQPCWMGSEHLLHHVVDAHFIPISVNIPNGQSIDTAAAMSCQMSQIEGVGCSTGEKAMTLSAWFQRSCTACPPMPTHCRLR